MSYYSNNEKLRLIREVDEVNTEYGPAPLSNIDTKLLRPDDIDIVAVGALVYRPDGSVILVRRKETPSEWIIAGGTVDPGENLLESTIREVKEETGVNAKLDSVIRIGLARDYSPPQFRESNIKRYGKPSINLLFVNFKAKELSGSLDCSQDPSHNILEARSFGQIPFDDITYVYKVLFVQQGLYQARLVDYPAVAFTPPSTRAMPQTR